MGDTRPAGKPPAVKPPQAERATADGQRAAPVAALVALGRRLHGQAEEKGEAEDERLTRIEAAIDLAGLVEHVTVLEFADTLRADQVLVNKAQSMGNVEIIKEAQTTEVIGDGTRVTALNYKDRAADEIKTIELAGIFVQIGLVPNSEFLKDSGVELSARGEIEVSDKGETSLPGIFAAGDVTTVPYKQIIIAMGEGSKASLGAFDYLIRNPEPSA